MISAARFYELSALLPEGVHWGDALSPHHLEAILQAAACSAPVAFGHDTMGENKHCRTLVSSVCEEDFDTPLYRLPIALRRAGSLRVFEGGYSFEAEPGSPLHELPIGHYTLFAKPYEKPNEKQERSIEQ